MTCWRHLWRKCKVLVMVAVTEVRTTMVPSEDVLPDVLPTERLTATGMAAPELRAELRKIDDVRNVGSVLLTWAHAAVTRSEEHTSELQSLMRNSYAVFCLKKKTHTK